MYQRRTLKPLTPYVAWRPTPAQVEAGIAALELPEPEPVKVRGPNRKDEWKLQVAAKKFLDLAMPPEYEWWANEDFGFVGSIEGARRKARGCKAGKPDFEFLPPSELEFFIEIKTKTGTLTDSQKKLFPRILATGRKIYVCRSMEEVVASLVAQNVPLRVSL